MALKRHDFFKEFDKTPRNERFEMIDTPNEATSLFTIYKQLQQVRSQIKYFTDREAHLLNLAQLGFRQLEDKKNNDSKTTQ